ALGRLDQVGHVAVAGVVVAEGVGDADDRPVEGVVRIAGGLDEGLAQEQREARIAIGGEALTQAGSRLVRAVRRARRASFAGSHGGCLLKSAFCQVVVSPSRLAATWNSWF